MTVEVIFVSSNLKIVSQNQLNIIVCISKSLQSKTGVGANEVLVERLLVSNKCVIHNYIERESNS